MLDEFSILSYGRAFDDHNEGGWNNVVKGILMDLLVVEKQYFVDNSTHDGVPPFCVSDETCNLETQIPVYVFLGLMIATFSLAALFNFALTIREIIHKSIFKSRLIFYILTLIYLIAKLVFFLTHLGAKAGGLSPKQLDGSNDFNPHIYLSTHIIWFWSGTIFSSAFLCLCINYTEIYLYSQGISTEFAKEQTKKLKMGVISVIIMIHVVDLVLFTSMIVFFHLGDTDMVRTTLIFQLLFNVGLSIVVVSFFILWIYVSRKFFEWKGMHSHERYIILTKRLFFVACFFVCLIILKALANVFLTVYVSLCGPVCVNVQIILNTCTCTVGDLIPLLSLYYTFWFFDKPKKKEAENNNLLIPVPKGNDTVLRTLHGTSLSSIPLEVQMIDEMSE